MYYLLLPIPDKLFASLRSVDLIKKPNGNTLNFQHNDIYIIHKDIKSIRKAILYI